MNRALALAAALWCMALAATPARLTVWLPERGQTAVLSAAGLVAADGTRVLLNRPADELPTERPLSGGYTRLFPSSRKAPARLEVVQGGAVTATRNLPEAKYVGELWGTLRGPCLVYNGGTSNDEMLTCFAPDLNSKWAKLTADPIGTYVSASGDTAYVVHTDWKLAHPYSGDVQVTRYDLNTNQQTRLTYRVPLDAQDTEYHRGVADSLDARDTIRFAAALPGDRLLICATMTMPKFGCRLDVVDHDFKTVLTLQGNAWIYLPQPTKDGSRLFYLGNTLQVWDSATGKRLANIHDPLWDRRKQYAYRVYLTPDNAQAAIVTYAASNGSPDLNRLTAYLYRLSDGKLLSSFAVKP